MPRQATDADYAKIQGGKPSVYKDNNGLWHIRHDYMKPPVDVCTHIEPSTRGTVIINDIEYCTAYLYQFEGGPCESQSRRAGGERY